MSDLEQNSSDEISMDQETALAEFDRLCKSWHLCTDDIDNKETVVSLVKYIREGVLIIKAGEEDKLVIQHNLCEPLSKKGGLNTLTYNYINTKALLKLDRIDNDKNYKIQVELICALSKMTSTSIEFMCIKDLNIGGAIGLLFLAY